MSKNPVVSVARTAEGREKALLKSGKEPLWFGVALDCIARYRASQEPLEKVVSSACRERNLGAHERKLTAAATFAWARHHTAYSQSLKEKLAKERGMPLRQRDLDAACLHLALYGEMAQEAQNAQALLPVILQQFIKESAPPPDLSLPVWLEKRLQEQYQEEWAPLRESLVKRTRWTLAFDPRFTNRAAVIADLDRLGWPYDQEEIAQAPTAIHIHKPWAATQLDTNIRQHVWPMDAGSQQIVHTLVAHVLQMRAKNPQAPLVVGDLCAGGGGKLRLLLALLPETEKNLTIVASDLTESRLEGALVRLSKTDRQRIFPCLSDAAQPSFAPETFDALLLDVPCTGTGTLAHAPDVALRLTPEKITEFATLQQKILQSGLHLTKSTGVLLYATCSILAEENELVVSQSLTNATSHATRNATRTAQHARLLPSFFMSVIQ